LDSLVRAAFTLKGGIESIQPAFRETLMVSLLTCHCPSCVITFSWWGIGYLSDPDSYAGWSFYTPGRASQVRQVEG